MNSSAANLWADVAKPLLKTASEARDAQLTKAFGQSQLMKIMIFNHRNVTLPTTQLFVKYVVKTTKKKTSKLHNNVPLYMEYTGGRYPLKATIMGMAFLWHGWIYLSRKILHKNST